jgi:hypothetical protein
MMSIKIFSNSEQRETTIAEPSTQTLALNYVKRDGHGQVLMA